MSDRHEGALLTGWNWAACCLAAFGGHSPKPDLANMYRGDATNAVIKTVSPEAADTTTRYASEMDEILITDRWCRIKIIDLRRLAVLLLMQALSFRFSRVTVELLGPVVAFFVSRKGH